ncbi:MAG: peptide chain release factor N(5)-glutamine methyltransferase [Pseudomonadales bacterium]|nr:peptide chain release factor N(5)-glutamine methyltransferase [Pseudomonadales bacterium]
MAYKKLAHLDSARLDAELLLAHILSVPRSHFYTWPDETVDAKQYSRFLVLLEKRSMHYPLAYLTGKREFWSLELTVNESVLIPRPETELLVEKALQLLSTNCFCEKPRVLDLGTGSGAIVCALAKERPDIFLLGVDKSEAALALAKQNAHSLALPNIEFICTSWFQGVRGPFDMIVSNPPYIDSEDKHLGEGGLRYEPIAALVADNAGMGDLCHICQNASHYLKVEGWLLLEHGWQQGARVRSLMRENGFGSIASYCDLAGHERVTLGQVLSVSDNE